MPGRPSLTVGGASAATTELALQMSIAVSAEMMPMIAVPVSFLRGIRRAPQTPLIYTHCSGAWVVELAILNISQAARISS
jgi:hypothetical protein